jgi:hypothetical protein
MENLQRDSLSLERAERYAADHGIILTPQDRANLTAIHKGGNRAANGFRNARD